MSDWYYAADGEQKGPINESELKANLAANKLPADSLVWKEGMDTWTPANQTTAFTFRQPPAPAKVQPSATAAALVSAIAPTPEVVTSASPTANPESAVPVSLKSLLGKPEALQVEDEDADKNKIFGILSYVPLPVPIWWLLGILVAKDSPYAKYHSNQGLVLGVIWVALFIVLWILGVFFAMLPSFLNFVFLLLNLVYIAPLIVAIMGMINAAAGKCVPLPLIGGVKLLK